ncbi:MAG: hypothetical protein J7623_13995 [Chitinophaga sp.]|uniref:hypothetical protein n=1 Tax=Chitinophaga sp. TaxID=1869181 RepID=UPI001B0D2E2F|nr:hypothetical protein [Chitinophaga sp.]MBO9729745.1 hypothetical protein [Chitinophaga sp.]
MKKLMLKGRQASSRSAYACGALLALTTITVSCTREATQVQVKEMKEVKTAPTEKASSTLAGTCCWVAITNQVPDRIEVYDPADASWTTPKWTWQPTTALSYNATSEIPLWGDPTDIKVRNNTVFANTNQVITATSYRLATIARYTGTGTRGQKLWVMGFNDTTFLHAMEILPDGNCVVASAGSSSPPAVGFIRIYSSSQPAPNHGVYTQYSLPSAHALLWDQTHQVLWALGNKLVKYAYNAPGSGGTAANPKLDTIAVYPKLPKAWGHDLSADVNNPDQLLLSTNGGTHIFKISTGTFQDIPGAAQQTFVKAISSQPGQNTLVETIPNSGCTTNGWCTTTVNFYDATTGAAIGSRTVQGSAIYKGKTFDPNYY